MRRAVLLLIRGCVSSQLTNFNLCFSFLLALGSSLTQLFLQWWLALGVNCVLENGERENCVTGVEPSLKEHLLKFHSLLYAALII